MGINLIDGIDAENSSQHRGREIEKEGGDEQRQTAESQSAGYQINQDGGKQMTYHDDNVVENREEMLV